MSLSLEHEGNKSTAKTKFLCRALSTGTHALSAIALRYLMKEISCGSIRFILPDGREIECFGPVSGPDAVVQFQSYFGVTRLLFGGYMGLGEGFIAGTWSTPSLRTLFRFGIANQEAFRKRLGGSSIARVIRKALRFVQRNSVSGSRRNIAFHYDLGNEFYKAWLDPSMTYSSGIFIDNSQTLNDAQREKCKRIVDKLEIKAHHNILEIGCGWGSLAEYIATETGAHVTAITISKEQHTFTVQRIKKAGLQDKVTVEMRDYRDVAGSYDRIVSVEMLEAVGEQNWWTFFNKINECLAHDGQAMLQVITVPDSRFQAYRKKSDIIQQRIFPGGMLLSPGEMKRQSGASGMTIKDTFYFGQSYGMTLDRWHDHFEQNWTGIKSLGFDEQFRRLWSYYLNYTAAGFHAGTINVGQFLIEKAR